MTREDEIAIASRAYGNRGSSFDFEAGARWADSNPKNQWISVDDDLPCNHEELLDLEYFQHTRPVIVSYNNGKYYGFVRMVKTADGWKWADQWSDITHWMGIPKISNEE